MNTVVGLDYKLKVRDTKRFPVKNMSASWIHEASGTIKDNLVPNEDPLIDNIYLLPMEFEHIGTHIIVLSKKDSKNNNIIKEDITLEVAEESQGVVQAKTKKLSIATNAKVAITYKELKRNEVI